MHFEIKVKLSLCILWKLTGQWRYSCTHYPHTGERWVASHAPVILFPVKEPLLSIEMVAWQPQSQSTGIGEEEEYYFLQEFSHDFCSTSTWPSHHTTWALSSPTHSMCLTVSLVGARQVTRICNVLTFLEGKRSLQDASQLFLWLLLQTIYCDVLNIHMLLASDTMKFEFIVVLCCI